MSEKSYFVRTCIRNEAGQLVAPSSHAKRFIWPEEVGSVVVAPDWDPNSVCGGGLHGLRPGDQIPGMWAEGPTAVWMICSYDPATAVVLEGKIKVPSCTVEYVVNETDGASTLVPLWLKKLGVTEPIYQAFVEVGDRETVSVGDRGTAKAGDHGISIAGDHGTAIVGEYGQATAGYHGQATAGYAGTAKTSTYGVATTGDFGTAIAGPRGTAIAGHGGKAQASVNGIIQIRWASGCLDRIAVGYVGEDGIEPGKLYQLDDQGKFVKVMDNA